MLVAMAFRCWCGDRVAIKHDIVASTRNCKRAPVRLPRTSWCLPHRENPQ